MAQCIILTGGTWNEPNRPRFSKNVGAYRVATSLNDAGYSTYVLDHISELTVDEIISVILNNITKDTLWVGFSSSFFWFPEHGKTDVHCDILKRKEMYWCHDQYAHKIISSIRNKNANVKIIYGGTKSEFFYGNDLHIDYYVIGLADVSIIDITKNIAEKISLPDLLDSRKYSDPDINNIDTNWGISGNSIMFQESLPIELARGCIFKCKFCTYPLLGKKKGTYFRPLDQVKHRLIDTYEKFGTTNYYITDDTVNDDIDKLYSLLEMVQTLPFKPKFSGFFRVDLINRYKEQAQLMVDLGVVGVFFGIETLQKESGRAIGKGLHPDKVKDTLYWLQEIWKNKINITAGLILGLPYDTMEYFDNLIEWCASTTCPIDTVNFYPLHLNKTDSNKPGMYKSEFSMNPEIYGYTFPGKDNFMDWELPSQGLSHTLVDRIAKEFTAIRHPINKVSGFEMMKYLTLGIPIEDMYTHTIVDLHKKHNIPALCDKRLAEYKSLIGIGRGVVYDNN